MTATYGKGWRYLPGWASAHNDALRANRDFLRRLRQRVSEQGAECVSIDGGEFPWTDERRTYAPHHRGGQYKAIKTGDAKMRLIIPDENWSQALASALLTAEDEDVIAVATEEAKALAQRATKRMGRKKLIMIEVAGGEAIPESVLTGDDVADEPKD